MIKKRILAIILCICMCLSCNILGVPLQIWAEDGQNVTSGTCGDNTTWTFDEGTGMLSLDGEGVVSNFRGWKEFAEKIKVIRVGKDITAIEGNSRGSSSIAQGAVNIEYYEVENGNANFSVVDGVLFNYDKSVLVNYPTKRIGAYEIPQGVTEIGRKAFGYCKELTQVSMPDSVEVIGREAFYPCINLSSVEIGTGVKVIEREAFYSTRRLTSITIPENVESIGYKAFADSGWSDDCEGLQSVAILGKDTKMLDSSDSETSDGNVYYAETFANCSGLREVRLACNVGSLSFRDCKALADVIIMDGVSQIGHAAFNGCNNIESIQLPESLKKIGNDVFTTDKITEFYIPANLEKMSGAAVRYCSNLTKFNINEKNNHFAMKDGVLFDSSFSEIIKYPQQKKDLSEYEIPSGVNEISNGAFYGCGALTEIILPKGIETIDRYAFADCPSLKYVAIPEGVKVLRGPMFSGSYALEYIVIPQSVTDIGSNKNTNHMLQAVDFDLDVYCYSTDFFSSYEQYKRLDNGIKLIYDANGGSSNIKEQIVYPTKLYENMPIPERKGYTFTGWYTHRDGGRKITAWSIVDQITEHTLYAHWENSKEPEENIKVADLSYSFGNNRNAFGYGSDYRIPLKIFQNIWGKSEMANYQYLKQGIWGGNCYGMAATSGMFNTQNSGAQVQKFRSDASKVSDLKTDDVNADWNMNVREYIETLFVSQYDFPIQRAYHDNKDKLSQLCSIVGEEKELALIAVFGTEGGHALLGYHLEDIDAATGKLYVYDCNYPLQERYITLTKNEKGIYSKWYYHLNNRYDWGTDYEGSWISYVPYSKYAAEWHNSVLQRDKTMNMLSVNVSDVVIENTNGNEIARIVNNELQTDRSDIIQSIDTGMTSDGETAQMKNLLYLPTDTYIVKNEDQSMDDFQVQFVNYDFGAQVTTSSDKVTITADDNSKSSSVTISSVPGDVYEIKLETSLGNAYRSVQVNGESTEKTVGASLNSGLVSLLNCSEDHMMMETDGNKSTYYTVVSKAEQGGKISPTGTYYVIPGSTVNYTMVSDEGSELKDVLVDDKSIGAVNSYVLNDISADHEILAKFEPESVLVENVMLNMTSTSMQDNGSLQLEAVIMPANATNKELKWSSDHTNVAIVDNSGLVMAVGTGQAVITAETVDGSGKKASCVITVTKEPGNGTNSENNPNSGTTSGGNASGGTGGSSSGGNHASGTIPGNSTGGNSNSSGTSSGTDQNGNNLTIKLSYYIVAFDTNDGTGLSRKTMTLLKDDNLGILPKVKRKNYSFVGWYTQQSGGKRVDSDTVLNAAATLYAQWKKTEKLPKVSSLVLKTVKTQQLKVSYKKIAGAEGYQILYSTDNNFKASTKKVLVSSVAKTIQNLKKGKTYYVKVRAYKIDSCGNKVYGTFSAKKSIKIKESKV